ncbi:RES family NAD+ phosphorylase [Massilia sp. W12]|uniref:RES family NAD+ phosphorylase n=1 Tax=Massilia sp. W12 TaxID=3126507 RepID=UPI0030D5870E
MHLTGNPPHLSPHATPLADIDWRPGFRVIPSRFPSINLFDRVAKEEDFEALYLLEAMTNPRLREEVGEISLVPPEQRRYGQGFGPIMAAFTHLNPEGSRFSDGGYGVFYAAEQAHTAIAETCYHSARFMRATSEAPQQLQMRLYHVDVCGRLHDARAAAASDPLQDPQHYGAAQAYAKTLREQGSLGLLYQSVRAPGSVCAAVFSTLALANCRHARYLRYEWDGARVTPFYYDNASMPTLV